MKNAIKLTRYRNIKLIRREAGEVLRVGVDLPLGQAVTLVRIGGAEWFDIEAKPAKIKKSKNKAVKPVIETK